MASQQRNKPYRKPRRRLYEEFEPDDLRRSGRGQDGNNLPPNSYDILAQHCGTTSSALRQYADIHRLKASCRLYKDILEYVRNSSGPGFGNRVTNIYKIMRKGEREPFSKLKDPYRMLLWHGTSPTNIPGIIQTGFRPGSGGSFGGGIYFADRIAKSVGYGRSSSAGSSFYVLAEVALGRVYKAHHRHMEYTTAPLLFDTVKGMGSQIPDWKQNKHYNGAILPSGGTTTNTRFAQFDLPYNEYIVYDPNRIIVRFVVECS